MAKLLIDVVKEKLLGEHFINRQHSNRHGEIYEITDMFPGISPCPIARIQYKDGTEDHFRINDMTNDEQIPNAQQCLAQLSQDTPPCDVCGQETYREGNSYKCDNCGTSLGCS